jgi:hypothetical protein
MLLTGDISGASFLISNVNVHITAKKSSSLKRTLRAMDSYDTEKKLG